MGIFASNTWYSIQYYMGYTGTGPWSDYGSPYSPCVFCRDSSGIVHLQGLVTNIGQIAPSGDGMFWLPQGFGIAPNTNLMFMCYSNEGGDMIGRIEAVGPDPTGADPNRHKYYTNFNYIVGGRVWMTLSSIRYMAES